MASVPRRGIRDTGPELSFPGGGYFCPPPRYFLYHSIICCFSSMDDIVDAEFGGERIDLCNILIEDAFQFVFGFPVKHKEF